MSVYTDKSLAYVYVADMVHVIMKVLHSPGIPYVPYIRTRNNDVP
jgi:hypothetical protein